MAMNYLFLGAIIIVALLVLPKIIYDKFATSPGTLIQLAAKGPQDLYLSGPSGYYKYYWPYYQGYYGYYGHSFPSYGRKRYFVYPPWYRRRGYYGPWHYIF